MIFKSDIKFIPIDFIDTALTEYQKQFLQMKFYVHNRFSELKKTTNYSIEEILFTISEDVKLEPQSVKMILHRLKKSKGYKSVTK